MIFMSFKIGKYFKILSERLKKFIVTRAVYLLVLIITFAYLAIDIKFFYGNLNQSQLVWFLSAAIINIPLIAQLKLKKKAIGNLDRLKEKALDILYTVAIGIVGLVAYFIYVNTSQVSFLLEAAFIFYAFVNLLCIWGLFSICVMLGYIYSSVRKSGETLFFILASIFVAILSIYYPREITSIIGEILTALGIIIGLVPIFTIKAIELSLNKDLDAKTKKFWRQTAVNSLKAVISFFLSFLLFIGSFAMSGQINIPQPASPILTLINNQILTFLSELYLVITFMALFIFLVGIRYFLTAMKNMVSEYDKVPVKGSKLKSIKSIK
jgi:hypothetical protein